MELQVLISKKGTKVVVASQLHIALELPTAQYPKNAKKWLTDVYEFRDGIRRPERLRDYGKRPVKDSILEDYYLSVELAKLIALSSSSKVKLKFAKYLLSLEDKVENAELLTKEQVLAVLELSKVMGLVSCQQSTERQHLQTYEARNGGQPGNWWHFRAKVLGYSTDQLREKMRQLGKSFRGKTQRQMLLQVDKYEMIRTAVIDLFMARGKSERYARNLGALAKAFARELKVDIFDDRSDLPGAFLPQVNADLVREVKGQREPDYLRLWQS